MPRLPKRLAFALTTLLALACGPAAASLITLQTRASGAAAPALGSDALNGAYYRNTVSSLTGQAPTAGY